MSWIVVRTAEDDGINYVAVPMSWVREAADRMVLSYRSKPVSNAIQKCLLQNSNWPRYGCTIVFMEFNSYKEAVRREREKHRDGTTYEESDGENIDIDVNEAILGENNVIDINELYSENLTSPIPVVVVVLLRRNL